MNKKKIVLLVLGVAAIVFLLTLIVNMFGGLITWIAGLFGAPEQKVTSVTSTIGNIAIAVVFLAAGFVLIEMPWIGIPLMATGALMAYGVIKQMFFTESLSE